MTSAPKIYIPDSPDPGVPELLPELAVLLVRGGQVPAVDTHVITVPLLAPSHAFSVKGLTQSPKHTTYFKSYYL